VAEPPEDIMCVCDENFVARVENGGDDSFVSPAISDASSFEIEVLVEPHLDRHDTDLVSRFVRRMDKLREPFRNRDACNVVVSCGDLTVEPPRNEESEVGGTDTDYEDIWTPAFDELRKHQSPPPGLLLVPGAVENASRYFDAFASNYVTPAGASTSQPDLVASVHHVRDSLDDLASPLAYLAVIGFYPLEGSTAQRIEQFDRCERLIRALALGVARNTPLYVIAVTRQQLFQDGQRVDGQGDASDFVHHLQRCRVSMLLHHGGDQPGVTTLSTVPTDPYGYKNELTLIGCPTFRRGSGTPGLARLRVNAHKGEVEIAFRYDMGSDREPTKPVQVVRPLDSASRVSSAERRLYSKVRDLVKATAADGADADALDRYRRHFEDTWETHGYVPLCMPDGGSLGMTATREAEYRLLLLLRQSDDGSYDMLLNHHTPLTPSPIAEWDTLLLPAFMRAQSLLEHLRDDVVRQAGERAEDLEQAERARALEAAVEAILKDTGGDDLWGDQIDEIASQTIRKISPTTGYVTDYKYRLVKVLPLVDRRARIFAGSEDGSTNNATHDDHWYQVGKIFDWLTRLDCVRRNGDTSGGLGIEALQSNGAGLRWDPESCVGEPNAHNRRRARRAPRGAVWFPLSRTGSPLWEDCPAIVTRNADVMRWIDTTLDEHRDEEHGQFPDDFVLGKGYRGG